MARKKRPSGDNKSKSFLPGNRGYRFPAEWEPHESTWIAWPHRRSDWPGKMPSIPWVYGEIVRWLHRFERVNILVNDLKAEQQALQILQNVDVDLKQIQF